MELSVATHRRLASVALLADEWQELHDSSGDVNPFSGPDWAITWLEHFTTRSVEPFVLEVREGARLVGVAPLVRRSRAGASVLEPIGHGGPWVGPYEVPAFCALPSLGREVGRAVVRHLCEQSGDWDWTTLIPGATAPWLEPEWLPDWSFTVQTRKLLAGVVLDLSCGTDIYSGRRNLKESFRRARNRLTRDFGPEGWTTRRICAPGDVPAAFDRLCDLHHQRSELTNGQPIHVDTFADPRVRAYLAAVVERMSRRGDVSLFELCIGAEVVASQLVLHTRTASYSSVSGAAEKAWPYSAVTYLQSMAVEHARSLGHRRFSLSQGPNQAKLRWTDQVELHPEFAIVGPRRRSRLMYLGLESGRAFVCFREARRAHRT